LGDTASIIVMGDFNATPSDEVIRELTEGSCLENLALGKAVQGEGSYRYRGAWEMIDQIFVSKLMIGTEGPFAADPDSFRVFDEQFLLVDDPDYPGKKPFATYGGYRWTGGYSDHLPVMITVKMR
jgi:endonuclease/exonuclease/phosphatase family metal-dependent hydrolase